MAESLEAARENKPEAPSGAGLSPEHGNARDSKDNLAKQNQQQRNDNTTLVKDKALPSLELTKQDRKEWTVAVLLAGTQPGTKDEPIGNGTESKLDTMKKLAEETKGKSVNFLVYAERTADQHNNVCNTEANRAGVGDCDNDALMANRAKTERYLIHDGKIEKLPDLKIRGAGEAITDLLKDTQKLPSDKLGLVIQSHGGGIAGIQTNLGNVSLKETINDIKKGLKGGEHDKVDILDFDGCSMGVPGVLDKTQSIAKNLVASSEIESATKGADGQNLKANFEALIKNTSMSGTQFGSTIVDQARGGDNGKEKHDGVLSLANFDLSKYDQFKSNLDKFGSELKNALGNKDLAKEVRAAVDAAKIADNGVQEDYKINDKDIKSFAENIVHSAEAGKINDPALLEAAKATLTSYNELATSQYGDKAIGREGTGGLATFLPGKEILDRTELGKLLSPLHDLDKGLGQVQQLNETLADRPTLMQQVDSVTRTVGQTMGRNTSEYKEMVQAAKELREAKTNEAMNESISRFRQLIHNIDKSPFGEALAVKQTAGIQNAWREYRATAHPTVTPGWDEFVKKLDGTRN